MTAPLTAEDLASIRRRTKQGATPGEGINIDEEDVLRLLDEVEQGRREKYTPAGNVIRLLRDELKRARALLKRIEWSGNFNGGDGDESNEACPVCGFVKEEHPFAPGGETGGKHEAGCELAALLGGTL